MDLTEVKKAFNYGIARKTVEINDETLVESLGNLVADESPSSPGHTDWSDDNRPVVKDQEDMKQSLHFRYPAESKIADFVQESGYIAVSLYVYLDESYVIGGDGAFIKIDESHIHVSVNDLSALVPFKNSYAQSDFIKLDILVMHSTEGLKIAFRENDDDDDITIDESDGSSHNFTDGDVNVGVDSDGQNHSDVFIRHIESGTKSQFTYNEIITKFKQISL